MMWMMRKADSLSNLHSTSYTHFGCYDIVYVVPTGPFLVCSMASVSCQFLPLQH